MENLKRLFELVAQNQDTSIPPLSRRALSTIVDQQRIWALDREILIWHRKSIDRRRLETIPGIGPIAASAMVASMGNATQFHSGRRFAAWLGLVPRQNSSGGKERLGRISKQGNIYIRRLLVLGATSLIRFARSKPLDQPAPGSPSGAPRLDRDRQIK